jgi:hypothetical protein
MQRSFYSWCSVAIELNILTNHNVVLSKLKFKTLFATCRWFAIKQKLKKERYIAYNAYSLIHGGKRVLNGVIIWILEERKTKFH